MNSQFGFLLFLILSSLQSSSPKHFIGYVKGVPAFNADDENRIYILENNSIGLLKEYPARYQPIMVSGDYFLYVKSLSFDYFIPVVSKSGKDSIVSVNVTPSLTVIDKSGHIFYTDLYDDFRIKKVISGKGIDLPWSGMVIAVINDELYFSKTANPELSSPNEDIYKASLNSPSNVPVKIISEVASDPTSISPEGKYLFDYKLSDGEFQPVIYDITTGESQLLPEAEAGYSKYPFFSRTSDSLIYYNKHTLQLKGILIEKLFSTSSDEEE